MQVALVYVIIIIVIVIYIKEIIMNFLPVILGTDVNSYSIARSFHMKYGIKSLVLGKARLLMTENSDIVDIIINKDLDDDAVMLDELNKIKEAHQDKELILVASSDSYAERVIMNKDKILGYNLPFTDKSLLNELILKKNFYDLCEKYGLKYPKSEYINKDNYKSYKTSFDFPMVLKPSNSVEYFFLDFEGKKKAYILKNEAELNKALNDIYMNGYDDYMIAQEFIEGADSNMHVVNAYVDSNGKLKLFSLGRALMEDPTPLLIGNYLAIADASQDAYEKIFPMIKNFLEKINYRGLANFDIKLDDRTKEYKVFEINLRQGRSSFFSTLAGANLAEALVNDFVYHKDDEIIIGKDKFLFLGARYETVLKYIESDAAKEKMSSYNDDIENMALYYRKDLNAKRKASLDEYYSRYDKRFEEFFKKKLVN